MLAPRDGESAGAAPAPAPPARLGRVLLWLRRDLRLDDNPALAAALALAAEVVPVYVYAPEEEGQFQPGRCARWWLRGSLAALRAELEAAGSGLVLRRAPASGAALLALARELGAQGVLFNHLYDPISMVRDAEVKAALGAAGLAVRSFCGDALREPWEVLDARGAPFTAYEPFWAAHGALGPPPAPLPAPRALPPLCAAAAAAAAAVPLGALGLQAPEEEAASAALAFRWRPGAAAGRAALADFVGRRLRAFSADRAKCDRASTSRLSPHLHLGEVSPRAVAAAAAAAAARWAAGGDAAGGAAAAAAFLRQLGFREYSRYLSFHFPFTHERALLEHLRAAPWRLDQRLFKAWRQGATGFPLVDAGMRELWSTGWAHNRVRVVAASFLVKHLLLPWQWGLKHFWDALLDADLECDALGWQYCAGCLCDAAELGHLPDHAAEAARFDPDGNYVRRWLPVLARLPREYVHAPWDAPPGVLEAAGVELGANYPRRVVDERAARAALAAAVAAVRAAAPPPAAGGGPFRPPTAAPAPAPARAREAAAAGGAGARGSAGSTGDGGTCASNAVDDGSSAAAWPRPRGAAAAAAAPAVAVAAAPAVAAAAAAAAAAAVGGAVSGSGGSCPANAPPLGGSAGGTGTGTGTGAALDLPSGSGGGAGGSVPPSRPAASAGGVNDRLRPEVAAPGDSSDEARPARQQAPKRPRTADAGGADGSS